MKREGMTRRQSSDVKKTFDPPVATRSGNPSAKAKGEPAEEVNVKADGERPKPVEQLDGAGRETKNAGSWLGWLSRSGAEPDKPAEESAEAARPSELIPVLEEPIHARPPAPETQVQRDTTGDRQSQKRTWLQMWSSDPAPQLGKSEATTSPSIAPDPLREGTKATSQGQALAPPSTSVSQSKASSIETAPPPALPGDESKSSGWVFWSRDRKNNGTASSEPHVGELAISDTPSQQRPKRASISLPDPKSSKDLTPKQKLQISETKNILELVAPKGKDSRPATPVIKPQEPKITDVGSPAARDRIPESDPSMHSQKTGHNIILPTFQDTFSLQETPTILEQLGRLLYYTKTTELKHLNRVREPPRIVNAIAIGVHGYFPAPFIRSVLGQPTGTSIKFADMAAKAIRTWTQDRGYSCEVKTAALEGEGRIAERVDMLWKLLLNWIDEIRKADFIMVACHSQGVPVATMLVAKLISFGCVNPSSVRIGICAMAGVSRGPFTDYKSRWISGTAGELFDFSDPATTVSKDYLGALETVLQFGARIAYVGSIDDQLVSLESSTFSPVSHPHIYRAVFIDSRIHAPSFISHLVGFALKLRNLGVPDHGLIRELSSPLAGSLYTGEGHSRIYEDETVYDLAVKFTLETTSMSNAELTQRPGPAPTASPNPYILPFAMRGILEEDYVRTELRDEARDLLQQFDEWKPTTKVLKDVKFRLEGIRSKI